MILVTGAAGYIGSHTTHQLVDEGQKVVCLDNFYSGFRWAIPPEAVLIEGSAGDSALVRKIIREYKVKSVIHFAGHIEVPESVLNPLKYYENNTSTSQRLLSVCMEEGVPRFVFSSTASVYGNAQDRPCDEKVLPSPINPYARSKLATEQMIEDCYRSVEARGLLPAEKHFSYVIFRYFNVAGARLDARIGQATPRATHLIKVACQAALGMRAGVQIYGTDYPTADGTGFRDYIHVEDLAAAHLLAVRYLENGGTPRLLNCGYGHGFSVRQVINQVKKVSGVNFDVHEGPRRFGDPASVVSDPSEVRKVLNWHPKYDDLEVICRTAYEWEKKYKQISTSS